MRFLIQELSKKHGKLFIWKFSATSHGKGVVDGVGGKIKSSVYNKVMRQGKDRPIVQDYESFAKIANELSESTTIIHTIKKEVSAYKDSNPFNKSVSIHGASKMQVMKSDGTSSYPWSNSSYHKAGTLDFFFKSSVPVQTSNSLSLQNSHQVIKHQTKK